jgi:adiponectin receptor
MNLNEYDACKTPTLVSSSNLPPGYVKRPFIHKYYRLNHGFFDCLKSIFVLHNETMNIWSHIIGAVIWLCMYENCKISEAYLKSDYLTQVFVNVSYGFCIFMPLLSSIYHTFNISTTCCCILVASNSSKTTIANNYENKKTTERTNFSLIDKFFLRLDLLGILLLWFSRVLLEGHLVWWCERDMFSNLMVISIVFFLICSPIILYKMQIFAFGPLFIVVHTPIASMIISMLWNSYDGLILTYMIYSISGTVCAFIAFYLYFNKIPECWSPGKYDLFGQSHNYWHFFTWLGPTLVLFGFDSLLKYRVLSGFKCAA